VLYSGIDAGAQSVKAVIFDGEKILGRKVHIVEEGADTAARRIYRELLDELGLRAEDVQKPFATGSMAGELSFTERKSSEENCAARGSRWLFPAARTVIDIGAEGCRVMKLAPEGALQDFATNSKCASGTGSFIELGAIYLKVPLDEIGSLSLAADGIAEVSSTCAVFAESVIISHIHKGESRERIAAGIHRAVATRIAELIGKVGLMEEAVIVGGGALNPGLVKSLEELVGVSFRIPEHPRTVTALGAAIQASRKNKD
jgi:predicted CoA-substrate-specific enzyme activase